MAPRCQPATLSQAEAVVDIDHRHSCARGFRLHRGTCHNKVGRMCRTKQEQMHVHLASTCVCVGQAQGL